MATFTAVGPRLDLDGPRPVAPPHSLLNTPGVVVERDSGRWLNGVNLLPRPSSAPSRWDACSDGTFRVKDDTDDREIVTFDAITAYIPVVCSTMGGDIILREGAVEALEAKVSFAVEAELAKGFAGSANKYLGDSDLDILGGGAVTPAVGLSYLENAIGATGQTGMIHATPAIIAALAADKLEGAETDPLLTDNGNRVVSGGGYIGTDPDGGSTPAAGQDWMFATGPVEVRLGPLDIFDLRVSLDRENNVITYRAEQPFLVVWDGTLQAGVLVDWSP